MDDKQKHYKFIPCKTDELGMKLEWENESDAPTDGDWNWWMDKDGNVEFARMKEDAYDHFYPSTKHLNLRGTDWEPQSLFGYFKEIDDGDVVRGHRLTDAEARDMQMREVDNALKLADVFPNPFSPEVCAGPHVKASMRFQAARREYEEARIALSSAKEKLDGFNKEITLGDIHKDEEE